MSQQLAHATRQGPLPGDAPTEVFLGQPAGRDSVKNIEQFDCISWNSCLECYDCIRHIPEHWSQAVWDARTAVGRGIIDATEQGHAIAAERLWKAFSIVMP